MNAVDERSETTRRRAWLASLLMRRESSMLGRLAAHLERLRHAPRPWRRRLQRQLAATLTGAALLLSMSGVHAQSGPVAPAATINVFDGEVAIAANGRCSLREAIINANNGNQTHGDCAAGAPGADAINLPANGTFLLQNGHTTVYSSLTGLPTITSAITLNGNGSTIRRDTTTKLRLLAVSGSGNLTLNQATLSNGHSTDDGGGIYSYGGIVTLNNSVISGNQADNAGGGLSNYPTQDGPEGTVTINQTVFRNNAAVGPGGAINMWDNDYIGGALNVTDSVLEGNTSSEGGAIHDHYGALAITRSTLTANSSSGPGGGIFIWGTQLNIDSSTLSDNAAGSSGGGIGTIGFFNMDVNNSTLSGNSAGGWGGGIDLDGGEWFGYGRIRNSTFTENRADYGGGIAVYYANAFLQRDLIAGNSASASNKGPEVFVHTASGATIQVNSHNLFGHSGNSGVVGFTPGATDIVPAAALVAIRNPNLANNGGATKTHALVANSPALDVAPNTACSASPINGVDQRSLPRNVNGKGGATANECDIGAFEAQGVPPAPAHLFLSPATAGTVSGIAAAPQDILRFDPVAGSWSMFFDGSDVGLTKALSSFTQMTNGDLLLSLKANQSLPGLGTVTPWDVVRFAPSSLGNNTAGSFSWYIDGSDVGLTTTAEKIDALDVLPDGRVLLSTAGALAVPKPGGGTLKMQDEDVAAFTPTTTGANTSGTWALYFNGTAIAGMGVEDVGGVSVDPPSGYLYVALGNAFNVGGVSGDGKDIIVLKPVYGGYKVERVFRGPNNGFNLVVAGLDRQ